MSDSDQMVLVKLTKILEIETFYSENDIFLTKKLKILNLDNFTIQQLFKYGKKLMIKIIIIFIYN